MCMYVYFPTKFQRPTMSVIRLSSAERLLFYKTIFSIKGAHSLKVYYHTPSNDPILSNVGIIPTSQVCTSSMLLLLFTRNKHYSTKVTTSGISHIKVKQSHYRPVQEDEAPRFQDSQHTKVVRLSALCTGHFLPPGNIPGTHFC